MVKILKKNKLLLLLIIISIITIIFSIILPALLKEEIKIEINNNISILVDSIKEGKISNFKTLITQIRTNTLLISTIWLFGISIIGIPIIILLYQLKLCIFSLKVFFIIKNIKKLNLLFIIIYLLPSFINIMFLFILTYYSCSYSIVLLKLLFLKKNYNISNITKKYIKIYFIFILLFIISNIIEIYIFPKILSLLLK